MTGLEVRCTDMGGFEESIYGTPSPGWWAAAQSGVLRGDGGHSWAAVAF
ncbi:MAG: hypothetical protein ACYDAQ_09650 [Mycobacteriales bacterium]